MTILLQTCTTCGAHHYPERDLCRVCLTDTLAPAEHSGRGRLLAAAMLHRTLDPAIAGQLPIRIGSIALDGGVRVIAFLDAGVAAGDGVVLRAGRDAAQHQIFTAHKE